MKINKKLTAYVKESSGGVTSETAEYVEKIVCNKCGVVLWTAADGGFGIPDYFRCAKEWLDGRWKGERHSFELCNQCYKNLLDAFQHPVEVVKTSAH